jgi:hypothetical protein
MKKLLILVGVVFMFTSLHAQKFNWKDYNSSSKFQDSWQYYYSKYHAYYRGMSMLAFYSNPKTDSNLISKETVYYKYKKGKKQQQANTRSISKFSEGLLTNYQYIKKGKIKTQFSFEYNEAGFYTKYCRGPQSAPTGEEIMVYNDSNRIVDYSSFNKKRKLKRKEAIKYNMNQKLIQKDIYDGIHPDPKFTWIYKYNEEGRRVQTEYYKKSKLKSKWVFTCDDEGKKVEHKDVKLTTTCSLVEHNNDGSYVKIYRNTDSKGKIRISRWSYSKDSVLIAYETRNHKGKITRKYTYEYDNQGNKIVYTYYKKGGKKISNVNKYKYDSDRHVVEIASYNSKGKMRKRKTFKYDSKGRNIENGIFNSKNIIVWKYVYTYNDKGEVISQITYKKDVPTYERDFIFQY